MQRSKNGKSYKSVAVFSGGMFSQTEMSEVLTEIVKMDPNFDREQFVKDCQNEMIPNILEVCMLREKGKIELA